MKIYTITMFMFALSLSITAISGMGLTESKLSVAGITDKEIKELLPDSVSYSDSDIGMFIYGDFLKGLKIFAKIFAFTPVILTSVLYAIGAPPIIITTVTVMLYLPYIAGIIQILMKFSIIGTE